MLDMADTLSRRQEAALITPRALRSPYKSYFIANVNVTVHSCGSIYCNIPHVIQNARSQTQVQGRNYSPPGKPPIDSLKVVEAVVAVQKVPWEQQSPQMALTGVVGSVAAPLCTKTQSASNTALVHVQLQA